MDFFGTVWGETPLHIAAVAADIEVIEMILDAGADKTVKTAKGDTPYDYALRRDRRKEIMLLLQ